MSTITQTAYVLEACALDKYIKRNEELLTRNQGEFFQRPFNRLQSYCNFIDLCSHINPAQAEFYRNGCASYCNGEMIQRVKAAMESGINSDNINLIKWLSFARQINRIFGKGTISPKINFVIPNKKDAKTEKGASSVVKPSTLAVSSHKEEKKDAKEAKEQKENSPAGAIERNQYSWPKPSTVFKDVVFNGKTHHCYFPR